MFIKCGLTELQDWHDHTVLNGKLVAINVHTGCGPADATAPVYVCSLIGNSHHWAALGGSSIYGPTAAGFRVNVGMDPAIWGSPLRRANAIGWKWQIAWTAFSETAFPQSADRYTYDPNFEVY